MKKFFSLILMIAVVFSLCAFSVSAEGGTASISIRFLDGETPVSELVPGTAYTMEMTITGSEAMTDGTLFFTLDNAKDFDLTAITNATIDNCGVVFESEYNYISIYGNGENTEYVLKFSFTPIEAGTASIAIQQDAADGESFMGNGDGDAVVVTSVIGNSITVKAAAPAVKTITKTGTDVLINNAKEKSEGVTTDVEIGGAAGFAFTIPAGVTLDDNMIWSLTTADGKLYSEKINAGLSTLGEGSPVKVAATFVTGTHKGADAANKEITAVNGIFKAGEDFYFTDAADAKNQAAAE